VARPAAPQTPSDVGSEWLFLAAIVERALQDMASANGAIRDDAARFWATPASVQYWADLLNVDPQRLRQAVARFQRRWED
jgi:hypothetical protein